MNTKIVPKSDLDKLEQARLDLYKLAEKHDIDICELLVVTQPMWRLVNCKYFELNKI